MLNIGGMIFNDKSKILFSSYAVINLEEFHFSHLVSCADLAKC